MPIDFRFEMIRAQPEAVQEIRHLRRQRDEAIQDYDAACSHKQSNGRLVAQSVNRMP
jgi:hypothetical protein